MDKFPLSINHYLRLAPILFLMIFSAPSVSYGDETDGTVEKLKRDIERIERQRQQDAEEFRRVIEQMRERDRRRQEEIEGLREQMRELQKAVPTQEEREKIEKGADLITEKIEPLMKNLRVYGDFRLRSELDSNRDGKPDPRFRERIRFRLGFDYKLLEDQLTVGVRVRTGDSSEPRSSHQSLESDFESFEIALDRAYLKYTPSFYPWVSLYGGKFAHPFKTKGVYKELVWDQDVQPEGFAATYKRRYDGLVDDAFLTVGQYLIEREGNDITSATVAQVAVGKSVADDWKVTLASGTYLYNDLTPGGLSDLVESPKNAGNAVRDTDGDGEPDEFVSDFYILDTFLTVEYSGFPKPIVLSGQYFHNFGADIDEDDGYSIGVQLGKASKPGDWKIYYQFQLVEQDAVFTPFSQDDFTLATNFRGHVAGITYRVSKRVGINVWTLIAQRDRTFGTLTDENQVRTRLDLNVRF